MRECFLTWAKFILNTDSRFKRKSFVVCATGVIENAFRLMTKDLCAVLALDEIHY